MDRLANFDARDRSGACAFLAPLGSPVMRSVTIALSVSILVVWAAIYAAGRIEQCSIVTDRGGSIIGEWCFTGPRALHWVSR